MSAESGSVERCNNMMAVGRYELARSTALDSLSGGDDDGELLAIAAQCTAEINGWEAGEPLYRRALAANPSFKVRAMAAHGLGRAGLLDDALPMFDALLAEDPRQPVVRQVLADVLLSTPQLSDEAGLSRAEQLLDEELRLSPTSPMVHFTAGRLAMKRNRWDEARSAIERGLALEPDNASGLRLLGAVSMAQGDDYAEAFENLKSAVRADPTDKPAAQLAELAEMQVLLGKAKSALAMSQALRRRQLATSAAMGGAIAAGVGPLLMFVGRSADSGAVELTGLIVALTGGLVAIVFMVVADRASKTIERLDLRSSPKD